MSLYIENFGTKDREGADPYKCKKCGGGKRLGYFKLGSERFDPAEFVQTPYPFYCTCKPEEEREEVRK